VLWKEYGDGILLMGNKAEFSSFGVPPRAFLGDDFLTPGPNGE